MALAAVPRGLQCRSKRSDTSHSQAQVLFEGEAVGASDGDVRMLEIGAQSSYNLHCRPCRMRRRLKESRSRRDISPNFWAAPYNLQIGASAAHLLEVNIPEFVQHSVRVWPNAKGLGAQAHSDGTDYHLLPGNFGRMASPEVRSKSRRGGADLLERESRPYEAAARSPGWVRFGASSESVRDCSEDHFERSALTATRSGRVRAATRG